MPDDRPPWRRHVSDLALAIGVTILYVLCAKLGLALAFGAPQVTAVWPPTGFALAVVWRFGWRGVPGIVAGAFVANATASEPLAVAAGIAVGNTLEALVGVFVLRRLGFDGRLTSLRDITSLIVAVATSPLVSATIGVSALGLGGVQPASRLAELWSLWWLGDTLGGLVVAPFLLVWSDKARAPRRQGAAAEAALLFGGLIAASAVAFLHPWVDLPSIKYAVFPFIIWAALRFGPAGTATAAIVINAIAVWGTAIGRGPFAGEAWEQGLVMLQIFVAVAAVTGLLLGGVAAQSRAAQQRAELSERRLLLAMSTARLGAWDWNIASGEVIWSSGLEPLHGIPRGGFEGTLDAFRALIHPDDLERVDTSIRNAVETRAPYEAEFRIRGADGVTRWIAARGQVFGEAADELRMVGVGIDITPQKDLEAELREKARELQEADRRKDEFLAMLGHELRNPLAAIVYADELLEKHDPLATGQGRAIIRRQSEHLTRLVDDLLDVARITRGTVRLERQRVKVERVIAPAVESWRDLIVERRQLFSIDGPAAPLWIDVDPMRFTQVISNLLHNAIKFSPEEARISIRVTEENGWAVIRVSDTGEGMTPKVSARVFELFAQGSPPLDRPQGGLGIGLTLVRRLVELHGGTVEAASNGAGLGSELTVRIPAAPPPADAATVLAKPVAATPARTTTRARQILVVEDHADVRNVLQMLLERDGHHVRTAADGPGALAEAQQLPPEVILLDIGLPGSNGYDVARELRAIPQCANAYLIAISGYGQRQDRARSAAAGFDLHLLKPIEPMKLLELLRELPDRSVDPGESNQRV